MPLRFAEHARVVFLTGAGVSVASGLRAYRGPGGLWSEVDVEEWATSTAMARDPERCWREHTAIARAMAAARPNAAHRAVAAFERRRDVGLVTVITQNVDGLHGRAGSTRVVELHGSLGRVRCTDAACGGASGPAPSGASAERMPRCPRCGEPVRYDAVLFGERIAPAVQRAASDAVREAELFVAAGTSGAVLPASRYAEDAHRAGARTVLVNLEPHDGDADWFRDTHMGRAEELLPELLGVSV